MSEQEARDFSSWWSDAGEQELRELLFWVWDPIGLNAEFPDAVDQYDGYALEIATVLASDIPAPAVAALLQTIERTRMGMDARPLDEVVSRLEAWYAKSRRQASRNQKPDAVGAIEV